MKKDDSNASTTISPEEEERLWEIARNRPGDSEAHVKLVELYLPLVVKMAGSTSIDIRRRIPFEELVSAGVVGLHDAVTNYVPREGVTFTTFAYKRINGAIIDELRGRDPLTRTQRSHYHSICEAITRLTCELKRPPTDGEIADATGMSVGEVDRYIGMGAETIKLSDEFEKGLSYMDVLADERSPSPRETAHRKMATERLFKEHFRQLSEREQKILFLKYFEEMSVKEIAKVFEISEGRVSQIYQKSILKLRAMMTVGTI